MNDGGIAAGLLLTMLAFALAFVPRRTAGIAVVLTMAATVLVALAAPSPQPEFAFAACWAALIATATGVYWPTPMGPRAGTVTAFSALVGSIAGLVLATGERWLALPLALAFVVVTIAAAACVKLGWEIALRVMTSWFLAVGLLVGAMPYLVTHPGYVPDHRG